MSLGLSEIPESGFVASRHMFSTWKNIYPVGVSLLCVAHIVCGGAVLVFVLLYITFSPI